MVPPVAMARGLAMVDLTPTLVVPDLGALAFFVTQEQPQLPICVLPSLPAIVTSSRHPEKRLCSRAQWSVISLAHHSYTGGETSFGRCCEQRRVRTVTRKVCSK
jgi:hypothetical protein